MLNNVRNNYTDKCCGYHNNDKHELGKRLSKRNRARENRAWRKDQQING